MNMPWSKSKPLVAPGGYPPGGDSRQVSPDAGLTLIECLVAIVIVALAGAIIAPAMVLSVATRVQSQRAEQALELAQSEIDNVRVLIERGEADETNMPPSTTVTDEKLLSQVDGPTYQSLEANPTNYAEARPVDINEDGTFDFAIQTFRTNQQDFDGDNPLAFGMGVRVYEYDVVNSNSTGSLNTERASLTMTSSEGERGQKPLAALYTTIAVSEQGQSFCNYITYLSTTADKPLGCN